MKLNPNSVPTFDQLNYPSLVALRELGGSGTIAEHLDKLIETHVFSSEVLNQPHKNSAQSELEYRLAWSRTWLKKGGLIENSARGVWSVTPAGETLGREGVQRAITALRKKDSENRKHVAEIDIHVSDIADDEQNWREFLLEKLKKMHPSAFERLAQRLLRESGFSKVQVTGKTGDGGIDGTGILQMNLISFPVLFQCKRYRQSVSPSEIRDFRGAMTGRTDKGLFITTGSFSSEARKEATRDGAPSIELIDGPQLCDHLKRLGMGVRVILVERVEIIDEWFDEFE
jgi:restriction system protein